MFQNRRQAGQLLAEELQRFRHEKNVLVFGLPRGGVPVARVVAEALGAELDVCLVRKLGAPGHPEYALGAVAEGGIRVLDSQLVAAFGLSAGQLEAMIQQAEAEIQRRSERYRGTRPVPDVHGRLVILVDDGLATGSTMLAAVRALRAQGAEKIVVAVPVGPAATCAAIRREADEVICLEVPEPFYAVGTWYDDFTQVDDQEVEDELASATRARLPS